MILHKFKYRQTPHQKLRTEEASWMRGKTSSRKSPSLLSTSTPRITYSHVDTAKDMMFMWGTLWNTLTPLIYFTLILGINKDIFYIHSFFVCIEIVLLYKVIWSACLILVPFNKVKIGLTFIKGWKHNWTGSRFLLSWLLCSKQKDWDCRQLHHNLVLNITCVTRDFFLVLVILLFIYLFIHCGYLCFHPSAE